MDCTFSLSFFFSYIFIARTVLCHLCNYCYAKLTVARYINTVFASKKGQLRHINLLLVTHLHKTWTSKCSEMRNFFTWACIFSRLYLNVYECKSIEQKVYSVTDRPLSERTCQQKTGGNGSGTYEGSYGHWGGIDGFIPCTVTAGWLDIITEGSAWSAVTDFADICLWPANT